MDLIYALARRLLPRKWRTALKRIGSRNPDEIGLVWHTLRGVQAGQMVDVGAHRGGAARPFLEVGWRVLAFEPDSANRTEMLAEFGNLAALTMDPRAVSDKVSDGQAFYTSSVSTGISSLHAFHSSHVPSQAVSVTTLDLALAEHGIAAVDFLKIDIEGLDLFALRGLDAAVPVRTVMAEFENRKTQSLGYGAADLADHLVARGFVVVASIWHPIVEYGRQHRWQAFARYPCSLPPDAWGNFIAFSSPADLKRFEKASRRWRWI